MKKAALIFSFILSSQLSFASVGPQCYSPDNKNLGRIIAGAIIGGATEAIVGRIVDHATQPRPERPTPTPRPERPAPIERDGMVRPNPCPAPGRN